MQMYERDGEQNDKEFTEQAILEPDETQLRILFGTFADIMFILLPYLVISIFKLWRSDVKSILLSYDLSSGGYPGWSRSGQIYHGPSD